MSSKIKTTGKTGSMLMAMAKRGGCMTTDHRGFPPSSVMLPLRRRGFVSLHRTGIRTCRYNIWHLTDKGRTAVGLNTDI